MLASADPLRRDKVWMGANPEDVVPFSARFDEIQQIDTCFSPVQRFRAGL